MRADRCGHGRAPARTALAGNPSDGYGGAVLAVALGEWSAQAWATPADRPAITPPSALVQAAVGRLASELEPRALQTAVRWESSIPRDVGLAGSSALVIAVLRALGELYGLALEPAALARLALAVELEELGIAAGPQDRVAQAYGGLTFMDFGGQHRYEPLDPDLLPPLAIAWRPGAGGHSGHVHSGLRDRHRAGEPLVLETMERLATAAREARTALLEGDVERFGGSMDATLDLRRGMLVLDPGCLEMVDAARRSDASANYTGSGGAIVVAAPDRARLRPAMEALHAIGCLAAPVLGHRTFTPG